MQRSTDEIRTAPVSIFYAKVPKPISSRMREFKSQSHRAWMRPLGRFPKDRHLHWLSLHVLKKELIRHGPSSRRRWYKSPETLLIYTKMAPVNDFFRYFYS